MMPNSAEAVAKELVEKLCQEVVGVHPQATGLKLLQIVRDALTTFAGQQVRKAEAQVWTEALDYASKACSSKFDFTLIEREFRRRAQENLSRSHSSTDGGKDG